MNVRIPSLNLRWCGKFELHRFQQDAVRVILEAYAQNLKAAFAVLPTGAGKTVIGACVAVFLLRFFGRRTLIITHKRELWLQWIETANDAACRLRKGARVTFAGTREGWDGDIVVASVGRLKPERLLQVDPHAFGLVIVDEAHHASSDSWLEPIHYFRPELRLGFSATPIRGDGICAAREFGDNIVYMVSLRRLIELGQLVDAVGWRMSTSIDLSQVPYKQDGDDYNERALAQAVNVKDRNRAAVKAYLDYSSDLQGIAFAVNVHHTRDLAAEYNLAGVEARSGWGDMPADEREAVFNACKQGRLRMLVNAQLATEGFNAPKIKSVVLARPFTERSARVQMPQMIGRGLRTDGEHDYAVIIQLIDEDKRRAGRDTVDVLAAFGIDPNDLEGIETNGRPVTEVIASVERKHHARLRQALINSVLAPPIDEEIMPHIPGGVERFDPIRAVETYAGLRHLPVCGDYYIPLTSDDPTNPRFIVVRQHSGLYHAILCSAQGGEAQHLTAAKDLETVARNVLWLLENSGESTVFADDNRGWRFDPMTDNQRECLARWARRDITHIRDMTKGEAGDIIRMLGIGVSARRAA